MTMSSSIPIQTPVTGSEYAGDQQEASQALAQFYQSLNLRDIKLMEQNWSDTADAVMDNPLGGIKRMERDQDDLREALSEQRRL